MAGRKNGNVAETVAALSKPVAEGLGLVLWDVRFVKEGASWFLRIFIDRPDGGVTLDDCERFHRTVDPLIDEADPVEQSYFLEVSSPGTERELRKQPHFACSVGRRVRVRLYKPEPSGGRELAGTLSAAGPDAFTLVFKGETREIRYSDAALVKWVDDNDMGGTE